MCTKNNQNGSDIIVAYVVVVAALSKFGAYNYSDRKGEDIRSVNNGRYMNSVLSRL
jgi:hypothetical protein